MKILSIQIKNIGIIADANIPFNKPLLLFYGEIQQGKSTILNAVRWVCGGAFPDDIIRHGETEAFIELSFDGGCIRREWYVSKKDKSVKAREVQYVLNGKPQPNPVSKIRDLLNPFLLDQNFLINKSELDRKKFFTELFAVDTAALDTEYFNNDRQAVALRAEIKGYGDINLTQVDRVDVSVLQAERAAKMLTYETAKHELENQLEQIAHKHAAEVSLFNAEIQSVREHNMRVKSAGDKLADVGAEITRLESQLAEANSRRDKIKAWMNSNPEKSEPSSPAEPDTSEIKRQIVALAPDLSALDSQISNAAAQNVRAEQYAKDKARADERAEKEKKLSALEERQRNIRKDKLAKLKEVSASTGIDGLEFDENGDFTYGGTSAGMLSTSQLMELSSRLSAKYPEGLGVEILDRAESLGKSIFKFVEKAKREETTILATIVGEAPAKVPDEIGVWVVDGGKVTPKEQKELL